MGWAFNSESIHVIGVVHFWTNSYPIMPDIHVCDYPFHVTITVWLLPRDYYRVIITAWLLPRDYYRVLLPRDYYRVTSPSRRKDHCSDQMTGFSLVG